MSGQIHGFAGQLLRVNLSSGKISKEPLDLDVARRLLGGKGYAAYVLYNELRPGIDPLGPENKLVFMTGPLTGTPAPLGNRFCVCTKSPLTGAWLDSHCGGSWGPELKWAGYDGVIVEGVASRPVYVSVDNEDVRINDASWLWGSDTFSTERILKDRHGSRGIPRVAGIGPAGEKLALVASVISEVRAAGRGGAGAVMGSKKLKAIVVRGDAKKPEDLVADPKAFGDAVKKAHGKTGEDFRTSVRKRGGLVIMGTANIVDGINEAGGWPTRNFQTGMFEHVLDVDGMVFTQKLWVPPESPGRRPCWNCTILCAHLGIVKEGRWAGTVTEGPEYETLWAYGPQCGVGSREAIARADYLSDYYGIDTISVGNTIGFLMECYEKGLISREETDGLDLRFGNADAMVEAVEKTGQLSGNLGRLIAMGSKKAAEKIGSGSDRFAIHVKGMEFPAYEPRAGQGMGLAYAKSDRGACHLRPWPAGAEMLGWDGKDPRTTEGKAKWIKDNTEDVASAFDSSGLCLFISFAINADDVYDMLAPATGFSGFTNAEFKRIGERINNLTRAFNVREGFSRKDDTLPYRQLNEPLPVGPCKGAVVRLDEMLPEYYLFCGWDSEGRPTAAKLKELGLDFAIG